MELEALLAGAVAFSVTLNLILVWLVVKGSNSKVEYLSCELLEFEPAEVAVPVTVVAEPETAPVKREQPALHQAWTNKTNIPWSELDRPRQEPIRPQVPGPRGRPSGFV